jgi:hypothetical protein
MPLILLHLDDSRADRQFRAKESMKVRYCTLKTSSASRDGVVGLGIITVERNCHLYTTLPEYLQHLVVNVDCIRIDLDKPIVLR